MTEVYAIALSRLGLSHKEFDDLTPFELHLALEDHEEYNSAHIKQLMGLQRYIGTVLRNKGLKESDQIRDPRRFYEFYWEKEKHTKPMSEKMWKSLDKKYNK